MANSELATVNACEQSNSTLINQSAELDSAQTIRLKFQILNLAVLFSRVDATKL